MAQHSFPPPQPLADRIQPRARDHRSLAHALTGLAGTCVEWYDFLLYATAAALVFPAIFFPATLSPSLALIASFSTFAVGFVARPIGAVLFGLIGDVVGRRTAFGAALVLMGVATTVIGLLPPYQKAGLFAPLALTTLRLLQGLAVGGQWGGAALLATETVSKSRRGLYGSIAQAGLPIGILLANLALLIANDVTSPAAFAAYGWRIPFLLSIAFVGLGLYVQFRVEDTAAFRHLQQERRQASRHAASPLLDAFRLHGRSILLAAGANLGGMFSFYILVTYVIGYGASAGGLQLSPHTMLAALLIAQIAFLPSVIFAGALADRFGRGQVFMAGVALLGLWGFIVFPMVETRSSIWITLALSVGLCFESLAYGPVAAMFAELFSTRVRYSAISLTYQISAIFGGALAPIVATGLRARYHNNISISIYIAVLCAVSLVCTHRLKQAPPSDIDDYAEPAAAYIGAHQRS